jgi:hypothetical protein
MDFLLQYVVPGLKILLWVCGACFILKWALFFWHYYKLNVLNVGNRNMPATREMVDAEVKVIRDKRHIVSLVVAMLVIIACLYGIDWFRRQSL